MVSKRERVRGGYAILGIQAKIQLYSTYGESGAEVILSALAQEVVLRPGDAPSVKHIRDRMGRHQRIQIRRGPANRFKRVLSGRETEFDQYAIQEEHPLSEAELQQFDPGEAVVLGQLGW